MRTSNAFKNMISSLAVHFVSMLLGFIAQAIFVRTLGTEYLGLNGLSGDFSKESKYYGLNEFKLGFNPRVFEYLGELDLVINEKAYNKLLATGKLHQMFDKPKG